MADIPDAGGIARRTLLLGAAGSAALLGGGGIAVHHEVASHPRLRRLIFGCGSTPEIPASDFTIVNGSYSSAAMSQNLPWQVALPPGASDAQRPIPLVLVLTGATGTPLSLSDAVGLPGYASAAGLPVAFACPSSGGPIYYHPRANGEDPLTWILEEFLPTVERQFGIGGSRANRAIYGWSMGGYGSLLFAAQRPRRFCAAVASSPAVYPSYQDAGGSQSAIFDNEQDWQRWGLWDDLGALDGVPVMINCGDADPFSDTAQRLLATIPGATGGVERGCHLPNFWRRQAPEQLRFLASHLNVAPARQ